MNERCRRDQQKQRIDKTEKGKCKRESISAKLKGEREWGKKELSRDEEGERKEEGGRRAAEKPLYQKVL